MTSRASFDAARAGRADTIASRFLDRAARDPERIAYNVFPLGALNSLGTLSWGEWMTRARGAAGGFLTQHIAKGERVAIFSGNRELWPVASMAVAITGLVAVHIAPDSSREVLSGQLRDCAPAVVIVDTLLRLKMVRAVQVQLQATFIILCDDLEPLRSSTAESLFEWETWIRRGAQALHEYEALRTELSNRIEAIVPGDVLSITYKNESTTGVMHTHEAAVQVAGLLATSLGLQYTHRVVVAASYSDPFHGAMAVHVAIYAGTTVALVEHPDDAKRASRLHRASHFCGTPRLYEEIGSALRTAADNGADLRGEATQMLGESCELFVLPALRVPTDSERELDRAGILLTTFYGVPERLCIAMNSASDWHDNSMGQPLPGAEIRVSVRSELQVKRDAATSVGFFGRDDEFRSILVESREFLRTGHLVEVVDGGALRLIGHAADLIELPGGSVANSLSIETELAAARHVAHAVCHANGNGSLVAVLSLRRAAVEAWARQQGVVAPWQALVAHPIVYDDLARSIAKINASRGAAEQIAEFDTTDLEFTTATGELDADGELNRATVMARFEHVFAELHSRSRTRR